MDKAISLKCYLKDFLEQQENYFKSQILIYKQDIEEAKFLLRKREEELKNIQHLRSIIGPLKLKIDEDGMARSTGEKEKIDY